MADLYYAESHRPSTKNFRQLAKMKYLNLSGNLIFVTIALVFLPSLLHALFRQWTRYRVSRQLGCQPPPSLPQKDPIFGFDVLKTLMQMVKSHRHNTFLRENFEKYGSTFRYTLFNKSQHCTIDPQNLKAVFSTDFAKWGVQPLRLFPLEPFIGKGIMTVDGKMWEHSRALIKPTFARAQISDFTALEVHVSRLLDLIPTDGSTVNLQPLFRRFGIDTSTEFLFGESVLSLVPGNNNIDAAAFIAAYNYGQKGAGVRMRLPRWNFLTRDKKFWKSCATAREFIERYVDLALAGAESNANGRRFILAHEMAKESRNREDIRNNLLNIFLPANDATAIVLTNIFFHLARNPRIWAKLQAEVLAHGSLDTGSSNLTLEGLKSMKYLQYTINEILRLHPPIGTLTRVALQDTMLPSGGGHDGKSPIFVMKGSALSSSLYCLHRSKEIYGEDALTFRPERWETLRPPHWGYLPFGGGPRVCPGQQYGLAEVAYTIVRFLQRFKSIENRDPVLEYVEEYRIATESTNGAKVALTSF